MKSIIRKMRVIRECQISAKVEKTACRFIYDCKDDGEDARDCWGWIQGKPDGTTFAYSREEDRQVFRLLDKDTDTIRTFTIPLGIEPGTDLIL